MDMRTSVVQEARQLLIADGDGSRAVPHQKAAAYQGGDARGLVCHARERRIQCSRRIIISPANRIPTDPHKLDRLIRAARWVRGRGQVRPLTEDPTAEESLGILFNIARRRRHISLESLAIQTGFQLEELVAFEMGLVPRPRVCEMLPQIAATMGIRIDDLIHSAHAGRSQEPARS